MRTSLTRRTFLRAAGVSLALPLLESRCPCEPPLASNAPPICLDLLDA